MNLEGRIDIRLDASGASICSTRPQLAQRLLAGRAPEESIRLAGLLFSLCGKAQRVAAEAACQAAAGIFPGAADLQRDQAILHELAREHAWRLLLQWPEQAGLTPDPAALQRLTAGRENLDVWLRDVLLGEPPADWLARDLDGFDAWRQQGATTAARLFAMLGEGADQGQSRAPLLPTVQALTDADARELARRASDEADFCACPDWHGRPAETGAVARCAAHPLLLAWLARRGRGAGARLLARLLELVLLPGWLQGPAPTLVRAWSLGDNAGLAAVETSRGLLLHGVRLDAGRVQQYRIVAPTEWNFHPAGPLLEALDALTGDDREARARLISQSLDPCVAFGIEVCDA